MIQTVPKITQAPVQASDTAVHYGYVAFHDISLQGPTGIEYRVQPDYSPYFTKIPARELIPFTNINVYEIDSSRAASHQDNRHRQKYTPPVAGRQKTARECVEEMVNCYMQWGFVELTPLRGLTEDVAFHIFQVIQPFAYSLRDIENEISFGAVERIAETDIFTVTYNGETATIEPLPDHLKAIAEEVRAIMASSASVAVDKATTIFENTELSMTKAFAGGEGKRGADPLDKYLAGELGKELPKLVTTNSSAQNQPVNQIAGVSPELLEIERKKLELMERQIALDEAKLGLSREAEAPADASTTAVGGVSEVKTAHKPDPRSKAVK